MTRRPLIDLRALRWQADLSTAHLACQDCPLCGRFVDGNRPHERPDGHGDPPGGWCSWMADSAPPARKRYMERYRGGGAAGG